MLRREVGCLIVVVEHANLRYWHVDAESPKNDGSLTGSRLLCVHSHCLRDGEDSLSLNSFGAKLLKFQS